LILEGSIRGPHPAGVSRHPWRAGSGFLNASVPRSASAVDAIVASFQAGRGGGAAAHSGRDILEIPAMSTLRATFLPRRDTIGGVLGEGLT
jgi:hypothetical protein